MLEDVLRQIGQRERFVLTSHARPDGDAVGSALACCQVLRAMGKQADVVLHDGVPRIYRSLPFADQVVQSNRVTSGYEAAIILECDSIHRTRLEGLEDQFLFSRRTKVLCFQNGVEAIAVVENHFGIFDTWSTG